jgi:hypothetical protein
MKIPRVSTKRRAVAGILAAVILFAMLFSVGAGYFLFVNTENGLYQSVLFNNANKVTNAVTEGVVVTTLATKTSPQHIGFYVNNTGGSTANVTSFYVSNSSGYVLACAGQGVPTPKCTSNSQFPIILNVGAGSQTVDTLFPPVSGVTYVLKILTARGNVFSTTYPPTATALASQALSSGAIGDLYMNFSSFRYFQTTTGGSCPAYVNGGTYSGYCISGSTVQPGFTLPYTTPASFAVFYVSITNYNPSHATITIDQFSLLMQLQLHGSSGVVPLIWYIISNSSKVAGTTLYPILQRFNLITLPYGVPTNLVFSAANPVCLAGQSSGTNGCQILSTSSGNLFKCGGSTCPGTGSTDPTFIVTHGWKAIPTTQTANYGQNSPYVTILYY